MARTMTLANSLGQVEELLGLAIPEPFLLSIKTYLNQGSHHGASLYDVTVELTTGKFARAFRHSDQNIDNILTRIIEDYNVVKTTGRTVQATARGNDSGNRPVDRQPGSSSQRNKKPTS